MAHPEESVPETGLDSFLDEPTEDLGGWAELWERDLVFPIRTHRPGLAGRLIVAAKRLARLFQPLFRAPQADLWERQRLFNQVLIARILELRRSLDTAAADVDALGKDLQEVQHEIVRDVKKIQRDISANVRGLADDLDDFRRQGLVDVMRHTDALFARLDQKLDRLRRVTRELVESSSCGDTD